MIEWPEFKFPPVNLWSLPYQWIYEDTTDEEV